MKYHEFVELVKEDGLDYQDEANLIRLLRARHFNIKKSLALYKDIVEWKSTNKVDSLRVADFEN